MASENLKQMNEQQLVSLFFARGRPAVLSTRAKAIVAELEARGLIFDIRGGDFVNCEQWNKRHGLDLPMDCERQARRLPLIRDE